MRLLPDDDFEPTQSLLQTAAKLKEERKKWRAWFKKTGGLEDGPETERWLDQLEKDPDGGPGFEDFRKGVTGRPIWVRDYVQPHSVKTKRGFDVFAWEKSQGLGPDTGFDMDAWNRDQTRAKAAGRRKHPNRPPDPDAD